MCKHPHWWKQFSLYEKHSAHEITKQRAFCELLIDKGNLSQAGLATFLACSMPMNGVTINEEVIAGKLCGIYLHSG